MRGISFGKLEKMDGEYFLLIIYSWKFTDSSFLQF